jgi:hypothetical protein
MNATAMSQDLLATLGLDAGSYPAVTGILRETAFTPEQLLAQELAVARDASAID